MKPALTAAVIAALALAGCGEDEPDPGETGDRVTLERMCPELGKPGTDALYMERAQNLVGLELARAEELAEDVGCRVVPASIDGEPQAITREYDPSRITVDVRDDEVTEIRGFG